MCTQTIVEQSCLSAAAFNKIPRIEQQVVALETLALTAIGELFLQHGMHEDYCAGLLHRHFDLQEGEVMVHSAFDNGTDVCKVRRLDEIGPSTILPHSLFLNEEENFQAFEYEIAAERRHLDSGFLTALRTLLLHFSLTELVALVPHPKLSSDRYPVTESLLPAGQGTRSSPSHTARSPAKAAHRAIVTGWRFDRDCAGALQISHTYQCETNEKTGLHEKVKK